MRCVDSGDRFVMNGQLGGFLFPVRIETPAPRRNVGGCDLGFGGPRHCCSAHLYLYSLYS